MIMIIRFLMTKPLIIVMKKELLTIAIVTVIMMTYKRNSIEKKKKNDLIKKLVRLTRAHRNIFYYQRQKHQIEILKTAIQKNKLKKWVI